MEANRLSPEIHHRVGGRYCSLRSREYSHTRYWRGYKNPTGSLEDGEKGIAVMQRGARDTFARLVNWG